jgi:hypothetical protein
VKLLRLSLLHGPDMFQLGQYAVEARQAVAESKKDKVAEEERDLERILSTKTAFATRRLQRAKSTGVWLTAMPNRLNGTDLTAEEFRDSLHLRYGITPWASPPNALAATPSSPCSTLCRARGEAS